MAKSRKLPSGKWNCTVYSHTDANGKRKYVSFTADTKAEANRLGAEFMANKHRESSPQDITVVTAIDNYISNKSNVLSPSTLKEYKNYKKYYNRLNNIRVGSLTSVDLQEFINDISKDRNPKTVRNIYSLLLSAIRMYSERTFRVTLPTNKVPERHIPTDSDIKNLLSNANTRLKLAIILGSQGMRRGEICALKYKDVMRENNAIYIHSDMVLGENGWVHKDIPKTSASTRTVILPKEVIEMIGTGDDEQYIIGVLPSTITSDFINLRNKLNLKCRFHDLRHYSASILHAIGLPDAFIMEHNGYRSDNVLKSVYRHSLSDKSDIFTAKANEYFAKNILQDKN